MTRRGAKPIVAIVAVLLGLALSAAAEPEVVPSDDLPPAALLRKAFDRMFNYPSVRTITLSIYRNDRLATRRSFEAAYTKIRGSGHTLLRFSAPDYLRGHTVLVIERADGATDTWIYRPEDRRPRRVQTAQKGDAFYGSDLTFEDLDHHDWDRFQVERLPNQSHSGRPCFVIRARPLDPSPYGQMIAWIERQRLAVVRIDFFGKNGDLPHKSLTLDPAKIQEENGHLIPGPMWIRQNGRAAATEVRLDRIEVDPGIAEQAFSLMRLSASGADLYELVERLSTKETR